MKTISDLSLYEKKVILRSGLNVPIEDGVIADDVRIKMALRTIKAVIEEEPKILLITSHLGRPGGKMKKELSLNVVFEKLKSEIPNLNFIKNLDEIKTLKKGIFLLENLRFWSEEEDNDEKFSEKIAGNFDVYINDAFSVSHRKHASIVGFSKFTKEKCAGILLSEEYKNLSKVRDIPEAPAIAIIGGAKIETKIPVIENLSNKYDCIILGGKVANEVLDKKIDLGEKVILPVDFSPESKKEQRLDIGPDTIAILKDKVREAKTIVWNGPLGKFEEEEAENGTRQAMKAIIDNHKAIQIIGGGETLEAVRRFGSFSGFDYVSMSGGAMLEFLSGKKLPGIEALEK